MKALILAAGYGRRLRPITNSIPKCMVEVGGVPLLERTLNYLVELGVKDVAIVVGHLADYIRARVGSTWRGANITYYENSRYLETNNVVSFYRAMPFFDDDLLMLECDLYYRKEILQALLESEGDCSILVSPFDPERMDGSVVFADQGRAAELVLGKWQTSGVDYSNALKTVNMYRFSKAFLQKFATLVEWYVNNMGENSYYEKALGAMIYLRENDVRVVNVSPDSWLEIDQVSDLNLKIIIKANTSLDELFLVLLLLLESFT